MIPALKMPWLFASIAILIRLLLYYNNVEVDPTVPIFLHLFLLVLTVFWATERLTRSGATSFLPIFKAGMRNGAVYCLLIAVFAWVFFTYVDATSMPVRVNALVDGAVAQGMDPVKAQEQFGTLFTPFNYAQITFFGLLFAAVFYAILLAVVQVKLLIPLKR